MPVREFTDGSGRSWRSWAVEPEALKPGTKDETYLAQLYLSGWIVFDATDGAEKRRLYPVPKKWHELPDSELAVLLEKAEVVPPRKLRKEKETTGPAAAREMERAATVAKELIENPEGAKEAAREETPDVTDIGVARAFRYPGGRLWSVRLSRPKRGGAPVLRFSTSGRDIDLVDWPKDWADYPNSGLVQLLREAAPRKQSSAPATGTPRRRWDDEQPAR